jgi:hypothetical protein
MSDAEIRDALKFSRRWFELGVVDDAWIAGAIRQYRESGDANDEHYRYGAFCHYLRKHPELTPQQCHALFELGANDPDSVMGTSIMLDILRRIECPDALYDIAAAHPFTQRYAADMLLRREAQRHAAQRRKEIQARGPEHYYREYGFRKNGKTRKDETVFKEMQDLFGIDWKTFHRIKNAVTQ